MQASPRWSGSGFRNLFPIPPDLRDRSTPGSTLTVFLCGGSRRVPTGPLPMVAPQDAWRRPPGSALRATWLGHSTALLEIGGLRVLTDPVRDARVAAAAARAEALPAGAGATAPAAADRRGGARGRCLPPELGRHAPGRRQRAAGPAAAWRRGACLPAHRGTFSLAMHAWYAPAEALFAQAQRQGVQLVMPKLGEMVVPAAADSVVRWWRAADHGAAAEMPAMRRPRALPFPLD